MQVNCGWNEIITEKEAWVRWFWRSGGIYAWFDHGGMK